MKKLLLIFCVVCFCGILNAQDYLFIFNEDLTFKTPDGKDYIVREFPGKTQKEIYDIVLANIYTKINADKDEISKIDGVQITAFADKYKLCKINFGFRLEADIYFTIIFKDGKLRVDAPVIKQFYSGGCEYYHDPKYVRRNLKKTGVFDPDDDVHKNFHASITKLINDAINMSPTEDW